MRAISIFLVIYSLFLNSCTFKSSSTSKRMPASVNKKLGCYDLARNVAGNIDKEFELKLIVKLSKKFSKQKYIEGSDKTFVINSLEKILETIKRAEDRIDELSNLSQLSKTEKKELKRLEAAIDLAPNKENVESTLIFMSEAAGRVSIDDIPVHPRAIKQWIRFDPFEEKNLTQKTFYFLKGEVFTLAPLIFIPALSIFLDGGITAAIMAGVKLSAGIKGLDITLDYFLKNAEKIIPKEKLVLLTAATTNLPELGASQVSALKGDAIFDVAATPLGSNPTNLALLGVALVGAMKNIAKKNNILKEGARFGPVAFFRTLKSIDYKAMKSSLGFGGLFALDAILFQTMVRPALQRGNYLPLIGWLSLNVPLLAIYFGKGIVKKNKDMSKLISKLALKNFDNHTAIVTRQSDQSFMAVRNKFLSIIEELKSEKAATGKLKPSVINKKVKELNTLIQNDGNAIKEIERMLTVMDDDQLQALLKLSGLTLEEAEKKSKKEIVKAVAGLVGAAGAIIALSNLLDSGVSDLPEAIPGLDKGAAGFFVMAFFSSLGELMVTSKLFGSANMGGGAQNITDSNAINIMLAKLALATSFLKSEFSENDNENDSQEDSQEIQEE